MKKKNIDSLKSILKGGVGDNISVENIRVIRVEVMSTRKTVGK